VSGVAAFGQSPRFEVKIVSKFDSFSPWSPYQLRDNGDFVGFGADSGVHIVSGNGATRRLLAGKAYNDAGDSGGDVTSLIPSYIERITGERINMTPANDFPKSAIHALNNTGIAAGMSSPFNEIPGLITTWNSRTGQVLQTFPEFGFSTVNAMNDRGDFVGNPESGGRGFAYSGGKKFIFTHTIIDDINENGEFTLYDINGPKVSDSSGVVRNLPFSPGYQAQATRLNTLGQFIGISGIDGVASSFFPAYWQSGKIYDFRTLCNLTGTDTITRLVDINNRGQIIGYGKFNGVEGTFIATPVPEPATLAALSLGTLALLRRRRK
jgi:hypothetical protein